MFQESVHNEGDVRIRGCTVALGAKEFTSGQHEFEFSVSRVAAHVRFTPQIGPSYVVQLFIVLADASTWGLNRVLSFEIGLFGK